MRKRFVAVLILAALVGAGFYFKNEAQQWLSELIRPEETEPIPTIRLEARGYQVIVPAAGELTGLQTTAILTPRVRTGSLKVGWMAPEGKIVDQGAPVVRFDKTDAQILLEQSQTQYQTFDHRIDQTRESAEGEMNVLALSELGALLEMDFAENQIRKDESIFSAWEIQESIMSAALAAYRKETIDQKKGLQQHLNSSDLKILGIDQEKAKAEMELASETLSSLEVRAPAAGVILYERHRMEPVQVGSEVWPGQPIAQIASLDQFRAKLQVLEADVSGVRVGNPVRIRLDSFPTLEVTGVIDKLASVASQIGRNDPRKYFECETRLEVSPELLRQLKPGMRVRSEIMTAAVDEALVLPKSAIIRKDAGFSVFVKIGETFEEKPVEIADSDHGFYVVRGLEPGAEVTLRHPFEKEQLRLPDFNAPSAATQGRRFVVFF